MSNPLEIANEFNQYFVNSINKIIDEIGVQYSNSIDSSKSNNV